jgi:hypothetical protein
MFLRRPILSVFAVLYIGAIFLLSLVRESSERTTVLGEVLILVPVGVMFVFLLGELRWVTALLLGGMICVWLELGRNAWFANRDAVNTDLGANLVGVAAGVLLTSAIVAIVQWRARRISEKLSLVTQDHERGLTTESPADRA